MSELAKVICLDDFRYSWRSGIATCMRCYHEWVAVIPNVVDVTKLECPECHIQDATFEEFDHE